MPEVALAAEGLEKRFGGLRAVAGVSLDVHVGEIHAVIGPNGAGKSTLINLLSGELSASAGTVRLGGRDVSGLPPDRLGLAGLGRSYQKTTIFLPFTVFENVRLAAQARAPGRLRMFGGAERDAAVAERAERGAGDRRARGPRRGRRRPPEPRRAAPARDRHGARHRPDDRAPRRAARRHGPGRGRRHDRAHPLAQGRARGADRRARHGRRLRARRPPDRHGGRPRHRLGGAGGGAPRSGGAHRLSRRGRPRMIALLSAEKLQAFYGASQILHGIDLSVVHGETVALMGRNGMGKTTLLRSLIGLVADRRGRILLQSRDITRAAPETIARGGVAFVPEGRGIFASLSVVENLIMAARPGRDGRRRWTLEKVFALFPRLAERRRNGGNQLSGGEQQMLTIGRALMTNPDLILIDEATEGLAPLVAQEIWRTIARIRAEGVATVIVDKDFRALSRIADKAMILSKGEIVFEGAPAELAGKRELLERHLGV